MIGASARTLSGMTCLAGVIGWPIAHSRSPKLHGYWLQKYGIDGAYVPLAVRPNDVGQAIAALPKLGFAGINVTVPHKQAVFALVDELDEVARRVGAVNTLVVRSDGGLRATNTDGYGFLKNLKEGAPKWCAADGPAVVLGAGGTARAVVVALLDVGAPSVRLVNRTLPRAVALAQELGGSIEPVAWQERADALDGAGLLVNTTTLGMEGHPPLDLDLSRLSRCAVVNDIVYVPLDTGLIKAARARGNVAVDGIGMLLHQARPGFWAWFGRDPDVDDDLREYVLADLGG